MFLYLFLLIFLISFPPLPSLLIFFIFQLLFYEYSIVIDLDLGLDMERIVVS